MPIGNFLPHYLLQPLRLPNGIGRVLQNALSWRLDPIAATEIDARLAAYGFDQEAINIDVYVQAREIFVLFESLLNAAQTKRMLLLREISRSPNRRLAGTRKVQL